MEEYLVPIDVSGHPKRDEFFRKMKGIHSDGTVILCMEGYELLVGFNPVVPFLARCQVLSFISEARQRLVV